ncbi:hypothetical protein M5K25_017177 [Dendrobium thyrsiflorum]|uniref:Uncharacterized protein n=1 Tax=Dendrobium thyrsiflorum TaxID=117978 RepID=A0ABD0ULM6_DENTH
MLDLPNQAATSYTRGPEGRNTKSEIRKDEDEVEIVEKERGEDPISFQREDIEGSYGERRGYGGSEQRDISLRKEPTRPETQAIDGAIDKQNDRILEELFLPGTQYFLRREIDEGSSDNISNVKSKEFYTLWRRNPGEHFRRILLSGNLISDHKCENHYYALRDVLKGLPASDSRTNL